MIGWGPGQGALPHDHPIGGCLGKVVRGPGLTETIWRKTNLKEFSDNEVLFDKMVVINNTRLHKCLKKSHGCRLKNQTLAWISKEDTHNVTAQNHQVTNMAGFDRMHSIENPHNETTLTLHYYYGDYIISFWDEVKQAYFRSGKAYGRDLHLKFTV